MAGLDKETLEMILDTLKKYAERKLTNDYLLELDYKDEFPHEVLLTESERFSIAGWFRPRAELPLENV